MDDMAAGDLDGDGVPEFVAGYNGGGGVRLFDASGKSRWRQGRSAGPLHRSQLAADGRIGTLRARARNVG